MQWIAAPQFRKLCGFHCEEALKPVLQSGSGEMMCRANLASEDLRRKNQEWIPFTPTFFSSRYTAFE